MWRGNIHFWLAGATLSLTVLPDGERVLFAPDWIRNI